MDAEIVTLINSGATTLLGLMITDTWSRAKHAAIELLKPPNAETSAMDSELEESRSRLQAALESGDADVESDLMAEWRSRIRRAVERDPELTNKLKAFIDRNTDAAKVYSDNRVKITMRAESHDSSRIYQQGYGTQYNYPKD